MSGRTWRMAGGVIVLIAIALVVMITLVFAATKPRATLTVIVRGPGDVVGPGHRGCSRRCRQRVSIGQAITLKARPGTGSHLVWWSGACTHRVQTRCAFRLSGSRTVTARFAPDSALASWNPYYHCTPIITTIPAILGSHQSSLGGATEAGGGFQPHLRGPEDQHLLKPPCSVGGRGTFVEIQNVVLAESPDHSADGDTTANMVDPNRPDITNVYMKTIHTEIDNQLFRHGVAPPIQPPKGTAVDIQGFVYWDVAHTAAQWHSFSGWEIHTVTAWRPAAG
ncbi:MAG: hypothetical protein QOF83_1717 [Solirubrobacteraceae bacterium]|nr:hypothetical protein [Solirubrobacteraceae bacterium]